MNIPVHARRAGFFLVLAAVAFVAMLPPAAQAVVIEYFFSNATFTDTSGAKNGWTGTINGTFDYNTHANKFERSNITISIFNPGPQTTQTFSNFSLINFGDLPNTTNQSLNFFVTTNNQQEQAGRFLVDRSPDGSTIRLLGVAPGDGFGYCLSPSSPNFCSSEGQLVESNTVGTGASIVPVPGPFSLLGLLPLGALATARRRLRRRYGGTTSAPENDAAMASSTLS